MDAIDCILGRRSRRHFSLKEVPATMIETILNCAVSAPSARDKQPWHFIVVKDKEKKQKLAELKCESNEEHILTAPITIVVCTDTKVSKRYVEDGVTATQNILLATHALGLGSVYVTGYSPKKPQVAAKIREVLSIPDNIMSIVIVPIGYPDDKIEEKKTGKPKVHDNAWQQ